MTPHTAQQRESPESPSADYTAERTDGLLVTRIYPSMAALGVAAARDFAAALRSVLADRDEASVIFACANSQLPFLQALRTRDDIEWGRVNVLHMDEYQGMSGDHSASFRRFLDEQLISWAHPLSFHQLAGDAVEPNREIERYTALLDELDPSICVLGIGTNGHLAFNDPPADFATTELVHLVTLDAACRRQQWEEGHFPTIDEVPTQALSLTTRALVKPRYVFCVVPEGRKAVAVRAAVEGPVSPNCPASILRTVPSARLYLDTDSGSLLSSLGPHRPPE